MFSRDILILVIICCFFLHINTTSAHSETQNIVKLNLSKTDFIESKDRIDKVVKTTDMEKFFTQLKKEEENKNANLKTNNIPNDLLETYAGMVGDKRTNNGLSLDLVMEQKNTNSSWLLIINGKDIQNPALIKTQLQNEPTTRFYIDVNTEILQDKTVNFTYQMPKDIRLKYGEQEHGYRIAIDLPKNTTIATKKVLTNEISIKFINKEIIEAQNKQKQTQQNTTDDLKIKEISAIKHDNKTNKIKLNHKKPFIIAIDPGHGGIDPGAKSISGQYEKNITLKYAKKLKEKLQKQGFKVIMTRENDKSVALANRVKIAQQANADLFISLHTDAHEDPKVSGTTVYRLSHIDKEHPDWNRFYNKNYLPKQYEKYVNNHNILDILVGMAHKAVLEKTSTLVDNILSSFKQNKICKHCRHGQRSLAVLRGLDMLSILIEIGYISNTVEEKKMLLESNIELFTNILTEILKISFEE